MTTHQVRLLIDPGSELSFISENLSRHLKLKRQTSSFSIIGMGNKKTTQTLGMVCITLKSIHTCQKVSIQAHILKSLTTLLPSFHSTNLNWSHLKGLKLADPNFLTPRIIEIVIGADFYGQIIKPNIIKGLPTEPIAQLTIFGWLVHGPLDFKQQQRKMALQMTAQPEEDTLHQALTKFWIQEEVTQELKQLTPEEEECEQHYLRTYTRDSSGRYIVRLPLLKSSQLLGNSYTRAHRCLMYQLRRLRRDDDYRQLYQNFMKDYEAMGHMIKVPDFSTLTVSGEDAGEMTLAHDVSASGGLRVSSGQSPVHRFFYLPHHGVLKPDSITTKLRVVFNGSAQSSTGLSVNDLMYTGANLNLEISDVLTWIRHHRHIFATDITKMYRQIKVHQDDWDLQRILWVDDDLKEVKYHLTTVTYGTKAAPFLATRTLIQLMKDEGRNYPLAIPSFQYGRYVDDLFGGADTIPQLIQVAQEVQQLCQAGQFPLAKWFATSLDVLHAVSNGDQENSTISFDDCETKILGIHWSPHEDTFKFHSKSYDHSRPISKRRILSEVAQIYDPLGFCSPVVVKAKMLLQELWLQKISWDDPLSSHLSKKWLLVRKDLESLAKLTIPRWFNTFSDSSVELHGFSDASTLAIPAVVYIRVNDSSSTGAKVSLVCSKTKVAPLKPVTIPRLELSAALLLAQLIKRVQATIQLRIDRILLWTDSQVTLSWITTQPSRWKDFVRNRVIKIQELSRDVQWRHIPGKSNPADCASRGLSTDQLLGHPLWWTGPPWLSDSSNSWPIQTPLPDELTTLEARPGVSFLSMAQKVDYHWDLIYRYSSLSKLTRITALCFRVCSRFQGLLGPENVMSIQPADIRKAIQFWVKATQAAFFASELKTLQNNSPLPTTHPFSRLTAYIDADGIIRVGGRLEHSHLSEQHRHPVILPQNSRLSLLIIDDAHSRTLHGGTQLTLSTIRQKYWIIGGRSPVKKHILKCVKCARMRGIRAHQLMGQLPLARVTPSKAFSNTGIDYAGPILLKTWRGRGSRSYKGWICVFVCLATSAVHLEIVSDYSAEGFLATYRRFVARRGIPSQVFSDCGTNFIGANSELKRLFSQSSREHHLIANTLLKDQTQWNFNPPAAPHMGGKWEAVVKSTKYHLKRTVGETLLTYEEFSTLLSQIEAVLNSRPPEPLSDDHEDVSALTPAHFLVGEPLTTVPEPSLQDINIMRLSRWQLIQQKLQQFWNLWSSHYLQRQQSISKWHHPNNNIHIGALVLITDERMPPSKWPLARVTALHPGKDHLTRIVTLKTATTTLIRPIRKLAILPVTTQEDKESSTSC